MKTDLLTSNAKLERQSGIELLKVIGILLVICSHVVQTLGSVNNSIPYQDYVIDLAKTTDSGSRFLLSLLRYSGQLGNTIFFVCSAWFLVDSKRLKAEKIFSMLFDVFVCSVLILCFTLFIRKGDVPRWMVIQSILPTAYSNNWYITMYLLFYSLHPAINTVILHLNKAGLLKAVLCLSFIYLGISYVLGSVYASSTLIIWITIYCLVAYSKLYLPHTANNIKINLIGLILGILGGCGIVLATNIISLHYNFLVDNLQRWNTASSPFFVLTAISAMNLARNIKFSNRFINYASSLSMLIYITHENIILRTYDRPMIWHTIYARFGQNYVLFWVVAMVAGLFIFWFAICSIYRFTLQKLVHSASTKALSIIRRIYSRIESIILKVN